MATPRNIISIPKLTDKWSAESARSTMEFLMQLRDQLTRGLQEGIHTKSVWIDTTFTAPLSTALVVRSGLATRPQSVELIEWRQTSVPVGPVALAGSLEWTWDNGNIVLPQLAGLTGSAAYLLRLLVREGG